MESIQLSLLPSSPERPGLEIAYKEAGETAAMPGD